MDAFQILVIILSAMLAIFLALGIILLIMFIRISLKIKHVTETISDATDQARDFLLNLKELASPILIAKIFIRFIKRAMDKRK